MTPLNTSQLVIGGTIRVPGDKSISHRSLIFSALASGRSEVRSILNSADVRATAEVLRALGANIPDLASSFVVKGASPVAMHSPQQALDCANSGTTARLMVGVVAGLAGREALFQGDASLSRRPMRRVVEPLATMGAQFLFEGADGHEGLPLRVYGAALTSISWQSVYASAQIKGAILLAALMSGVSARFSEPHRSRDHTERMLAARGVHLDVTDTTVHLASAQTLQPLDVDVPADPSSAAFFAALAALANSGELRLVDVALNPTRTGAFEILRRMGARIAVEDERVVGGESIGTFVVSPGELRATEIEAAEVPRCIDELPILACVASRAHGETRITGASELRVKESDRIAAVVQNLRAIGADAEELADGLCIRGHERALKGRVVTHGDHRLAMAFGILAAMPGNAIVIDDPACVDVSFPSFWSDLARVVAGNEFSGEKSGDARLPESGTAHAAVDRMVIAIDGPAASGKSSTAQWVAHRVGFRHVDSGALYRVLTALGLRAGLDPEQWTAQSLLALTSRVQLQMNVRSLVPLVDGQVIDEELRSQGVTRNVSSVAQMPAIRAWVNERVRDAAKIADVVVDGRDIGTAVFPDATLKIFLVADPWERARRRLVQRLGKRPSDAEIALETEGLVSRDALDATQSAPARDAITIDTSALTQEEQVERIVALANATKERLKRS